MSVLNVKRCKRREPNVLSYFVITFLQFLAPPFPKVEIKLNTIVT